MAAEPIVADDDDAKRHRSVSKRMINISVSLLKFPVMQKIITEIFLRTCGENSRLRTSKNHLKTQVFYSLSCREESYAFIRNQREKLTRQLIFSQKQISVQMRPVRDHRAKLSKTC